MIAAGADRRVHLSLADAHSQRDLLVAPRLKLLPTVPKGVTLTNSGRSHTYKGTLDVFVDRTNKTAAVAVVNEVATRDYIASVVGSESQPGWPAEALKAQAVLASTRLVRMLAAEKVIGDSTNEQAYLGSQYERPGIREAVEKTWGECVVFDHRPILAFYHSTCAGGTSRGVDIFGKGADLPYLTSVRCHNCKQSPFWKKTVSRVPAHVFGKALGILLMTELRPIGQAKAIEVFMPEIVRRDQQQRPVEVKTTTEHKARLQVGLSFRPVAKFESGYEFWIRLGNKMGWDKAPGTRYWLRPDGDVVEISSTGAGHGVGLCQWGACGLARAGKNYGEILQYYFPGTSVRKGF